jgi:CRISPR system Cascade subunit CasE
MYLARAFLDPASRDVRRDIKDPQGLHKTIMRAFPDNSGPSPRKEHSILHRLDEEPGGRVVLLIQSATAPSWEKLPSGYVLDVASDLDLAFSSVSNNPALRSVAAEHAAIQRGGRFLFRLRANTTRKIDTKTRADGAKSNGRRVPVRGDVERQAWLGRRALRCGFSLEPSALRITELPTQIARGPKSLAVAGALFEGILRVENAEAFRLALKEGIGPAKAYGFGLLSLRALP